MLELSQQYLTYFIPVPLFWISPRFIFTTTQQTQVSYNASSLADYLIHTGQFVEPTTRSPITEEHLWELGEALTAAGQDKLREALADAYARPEAYRAEKEKRDLMEALDRCVGEVVSGMLRLVEDESHDDDDSGEDEVRLCVLLSHFSHFFSQLLDASGGREEVTLQCLDQYYRLLR